LICLEIENVAGYLEGNCTNDYDCNDNQFCCNNSGFCEVVMNKCLNLTCVNFQEIEGHKCVLKPNFNFSTGYSLNVIDACGNNTTIYNNPQRIVPAASSVTEILCAIDGYSNRKSFSWNKSMF